MFHWVSNITAKVLANLSQHRSPNQIAWGAAIGVVVGVIPRDNLVVLLGLFLLFVCRVNQLVGCVFILLGMMMGPLIEPMTSAMGTILLAQAPVVRLISRMYEVPILPWLCLENSMVLGGLTLGLFCLAPSYFACRWTIGKSNQSHRQRQIRKAVDDAVAYRQTVIDQSKNRNTHVESKDDTTLRIVGTAIESNVNSDNDASGSDSAPILDDLATRGTHDTVHRMANSVSQLHVMLPKPRLYIERDVSSDTDTILRETVIEVVRYRRPKNESTLAPQSDSDSNQSKANINTGTPMSTGNVTPNVVESNTRKDLIHAGHTHTDHTGDDSESSQMGVHLSQREESLKYLLSHLAGNRETAKRIPGRTA